MFDFNGVNVAKHWHVAGEVFAISDCLVLVELAQIFCTHNQSAIIQSCCCLSTPLLNVNSITITNNIK